MTVYDCCMFLNENDLYEIRLNQHWNFVDKFIVIEAGETHTGLKKSPKFDHERFKPYASKIEYRFFDSFEEEMKKHPYLLDSVSFSISGPAEKDHTRDHFQANYFFKVLNDLAAKDDDIAYVSCLDEIIKEESFNEALKVFENKNVLYGRGLRPVFGFHMYLYAYKFNLLHQHCDNHIAGMITEVGNFKKILPASIRAINAVTHPHIRNGGYHFTFLDKTEGEMVLEKQKSWAHSKDIYPGKKRKFDFTNTDEALQRLFEDYPVKKVPILESTHPKYIVDNLDKLQHFVYNKEL